MELGLGVETDVQDHESIALVYETVQGFESIALGYRTAELEHKIDCHGLEAAESGYQIDDLMEHLIECQPCHVT